MPPRPSRWAYGFLKEAACAGWQVSQSAVGVLTSRCAVFGSGVWTEWQERQLTVSVDAWMPVLKEACVLSLTWQSRQKSAPARPLKTRMSDLSSPLESMCLVPTPWQATQAAPGPASLAMAAGIRLCGFPGNDLP